MDAAHPDLVRAWQLYFGQRGGAGPSLPPDVLPVIVLDDNTGWPPHQPFFSQNICTAVAGQRSSVGIANVDGYSTTGGTQVIQPIKSAAVIDKILWRCGVASDILIAISTLNLNPFTFGDKAVDDAHPAKDVIGAQFPRIGNVFTGTRTQAAQLGDSGPCYLDALTHELNGQWILGPGQVLYVQENVLADLFQVYFQGRYYGGR